jgi:hypothetical protein
MRCFGWRGRLGCRGWWGESEYSEKLLFLCCLGRGIDEKYVVILDKNVARIGFEDLGVASYFGGGSGQPVFDEDSCLT